MVNAVKTSQAVRYGAWALAVVACVLAAPAHGVQIQDLVRLKGTETSTLNGMGLVVGLNGTGDGDKSLPTIRKLANMMTVLEAHRRFNAKTGITFSSLYPGVSPDSTTFDHPSSQCQIFGRVSYCKCVFSQVASQSLLCSVTRSHGSGSSFLCS